MNPPSPLIHWLPVPELLGWWGFLLFLYPGQGLCLYLYLFPFLSLLMEIQVIQE